jgi:hypothetical protein
MLEEIMLFNPPHLVAFFEGKNNPGGDTRTGDNSVIIGVLFWVDVVITLKREDLNILKLLGSLCY